MAEIGSALAHFLERLHDLFRQRVLEDVAVGADTSTDALVATLPVAKGPATIAAAPNGRKLYITHPDAGKLTVLDGASLTPPRVVDIKGTPFGVAVAPDGRVFVSDRQRNVVTVLDGNTLSPSQRSRSGARRRMSPSPRSTGACSSPIARATA